MEQESTTEPSSCDKIAKTEEIIARDSIQTGSQPISSLYPIENYTKQIQYWEKLYRVSRGVNKQ